MTLVAKSDQSTGNSVYCSYVLRSNDLTITFTAPYSRKNVNDSGNIPFKHFDQQQACDFICSHGLAVRAVGKVDLCHLQATCCLPDVHLLLVVFGCGDLVQSAFNANLKHRTTLQLANTVTLEDACCK